MAFTWSSLKVGDMPKKGDIDEIRQNIESLYNQLGRGYQWKYNENAVKGNMYEYDRIKELRDALDYLDSIKCNDCSAYNSFELVAAYPLANDGYDSGVYGGYDSTVYSGDDNNAYSGNDSNQHGAYFVQQNAANDSGNDFSADGSYYTGDNYEANSGAFDLEYTGDNNTYDDNVGGGVCSGNDSTYYGTNYSGDLGTNYGIVCTTEYYDDNATYFMLENSANDNGNDYAYDGTDYATDCSGYNVGADGTYYGTENSGNLILAKNYDGGCSGNDSGYDGTFNNVVKDPYCTSVLSTDLGTYV